MYFLIFACSLLCLSFINYPTKTILKTNPTNLNKRHLKMLQFVKFAPIISFLILFILVLTFFHTKEGIRLSHAWYVAQFWAYTAFLYCSYAITKKKSCLTLMPLSLAIAIYNTPLFHYESVFIGRYILISDLFGILMFLAIWIATSKILFKFKGKGRKKILLIKN